MTTMVQMQSLYGYNAESRKAEKEMERVAVLRKWGWGTSVAVVLLSLLLWNLRLRKGKEINRLLAEHWQASEQISFARKQVEELSKQKEDSNQRIQSLSTLLREAEKREKELNEQIQRIATVKRRRDLPNTDIVKAFHRFAIDRSNLKQVHWQMLRELVEGAFPSFYEELHRGAAPLTDNEYQMCLLMKCKFQTKEIDNILGTHNYTSSTQKRLLKKVYGVDGDAKTFAKKVAEISE